VGNRRVLIAVIAVVLAAAAGVGAWSYVSGADQRAEDKAKLVEAYVAKQDIAKGTSGDQVVGSDLLEKRAVPSAAVPSAAVRNSATLKGKVTAAAISAGQFIVADQFVAPGQGGGGVGGALATGKQAITVSVDQAHGVAGFVNPDDHVNVIVTAKLRKDPQAPFSPSQPDNIAAFMVQNVKVLAVGQQSDAPANGNGKTTSTTQASSDTNRGLVTLEVDAGDAERLAFAQQNYQIYLTLVPPSYTPQNVPSVGDTAVVPPTADLLRKY
jgi:pilus assembly protein CpaB